MFEEVISSLPNRYEDNYDYYRFGPLSDRKGMLSPKTLAKTFLGKKGYENVIDLSESLLEAVGALRPNWTSLEKLHRMLDDDQSRELLIKLMAFRCLGYRKVKLPLNTPEYWKAIQHLETVADGNDYIEVPGSCCKLYRMDLTAIGIPITLYCRPSAAYAVFVLQHYRCEVDSCAIEVGPGDSVIDVGACWGDTALYFAHRVKPSGKVYSFEFIPGNLIIFNKNMSLNRDLSKRIQLIPYAAWSTSNLTLSYTNQGPGSKVLDDSSARSEERLRTLAIDDLVRDNRISSVDFIKMDIEGSELPALKGAADTIRRFKPRLAISVYHRWSDYADIPLFLDSLGLGYKFYLRHSSIHTEETVLFAKSE